MPSVSERSLRAKIAAHERWAREPDRSAATAAARQANADRYLEAARVLNPSLSEDELRVRAANLKSADMIRLARARWAKSEKAPALQRRAPRRSRVPARTPPQPDDTTTTDQPPMLFEWRPCVRHAHLGVSILVGRGFKPMCFTETGSSHSVDPAELETAA